LLILELEIASNNELFRGAVLFVFVWSNLLFMIAIFSFLYIPDIGVKPLSIWLYLLIAFFVALEGPLATLTAAVASSTGYLDPVWVFVSASCGNLSADFLWYSLGYMGKTELLVRYGGWAGVRQDTILRLKQGINEHVVKLLFFAKLGTGLIIPTLVASGLAHVPWRRWIGVLLTAEFIHTGSLVLAGYYYGQHILHIETSLKWISIGVSALIVIVMGIYLKRRRTRRDNL